MASFIWCPDFWSLDCKSPSFSARTTYGLNITLRQNKLLFMQFNFLVGWLVLFFECDINTLVVWATDTWRWHRILDGSSVFSHAFLFTVERAVVSVRLGCSNITLDLLQYNWHMGLRPLLHSYHYGSLLCITCERFTALVEEGQFSAGTAVDSMISQSLWKEHGYRNIWWMW